MSGPTFDQQSTGAPTQWISSWPTHMYLARSLKMFKLLTIPEFWNLWPFHTKACSFPTIRGVVSTEIWQSTERRCAYVSESQNCLKQHHLSMILQTFQLILVNEFLTYLNTEMSSFPCWILVSTFSKSGFSLILTKDKTLPYNKCKNFIIAFLIPKILRNAQMFNDIQSFWVLLG